MKTLEFKNFSPAEHRVWGQLFSQLDVAREKSIHPLFARGVECLGLTGAGVPVLDDVNRRLRAASGFVGVPVEGLEEATNFFVMLQNRQFPIGNFIRDARDISYTPAPDVFHDLYGHLPFLADKNYADFCAELGARALSHRQYPELLRQWERLFWFGVEFSLVKSERGHLIFGAGIASSNGECVYALSSKPSIKGFDLEEIRHRDYSIDKFQDVLFLLESPEQLYSCLDELDQKCRSEWPIAI